MRLNYIPVTQISHRIHPQARRAASGIDMSQCIDVANRDFAADDSALVVYTRSNPILVVFKQFSSVTSGTSSGSANVISTHYQPIIVSTTQKTLPTRGVVGEHTLYKAAPCCAVSITWMVALFPTTALKFAGNGT